MFPTGDTSDGLMEEFRRYEGEFKNGDETVQHKIAFSVFTTISSEPTKMKERSAIGIRSGLLESFSERLSSDCASTLSEVEGVLSSGIVERLCTRIESGSEDESESGSVDIVATLTVLDKFCSGLIQVIETAKSTTTESNTVPKEDSFSLTHRCEFTLTRIEKAVVTLGQTLNKDGRNKRDEKTQHLLKEAGGIVFRHFFSSSIQSPSKRKVGSIGIELAAVGSEMDDRMRQIETEREKERNEREMEKETARKAEEQRQREFTRKMREMETEREKEKREMEEMKRMNEELIEELRQRREEKKREEERRMNVKEGAAAIEVFAQGSFTLFYNVFTKRVHSDSSLVSHSFGPVVVRITFLVRNWGSSFFHVGLIASEIDEKVTPDLGWFPNLKRAASWSVRKGYQSACQNCKESHKGSACKAVADGQRVVMEADGREGKRTLKLSQDGETQPVFFSNIPVPFRFAIQMYGARDSVEIVSSEVLGEASMVGGSVEVVMD
ncbi:hypothetical protein BLNAU_12142 [Blattamonas nauphoetae]|uniref:Copper-fist domain-containing protein n=1 Tax=Blattamonas nauphoetae TaxID=2049346 RepID=A0ABQ9XLP2_9EUKA|nr:hypothetical protein BLNAU_12142 [Blattamonas nauphoetae]